MKGPSPARDSKREHSRQGGPRLGEGPKARGVAADVNVERAETLAEQRYAVKHKFLRKSGFTEIFSISIIFHVLMVLLFILETANGPAAAPAGAALSEPFEN